MSGTSDKFPLPGEGGPPSVEKGHPLAEETTSTKKVSPPREEHTPLTEEATSAPEDRVSRDTSRPYLVAGFLLVNVAIIASFVAYWRQGPQRPGHEAELEELRAPPMLEEPLGQADGRAESERVDIELPDWPPSSGGDAAEGGSAEEGEGEGAPDEAADSAEGQEMEGDRASEDFDESSVEGKVPEEDPASFVEGKVPEEDTSQFSEANPGGPPTEKGGTFDGSAYSRDTFQAQSYAEMRGSAGQGPRGGGKSGGAQQGGAPWDLPGMTNASGAPGMGVGGPGALQPSLGKAGAMARAKLGGGPGMRGSGAMNGGMGAPGTGQAPGLSQNTLLPGTAFEIIGATLIPGQKEMSLQKLMLGVLSLQLDQSLALSGKDAARVAELLTDWRTQAITLSNAELALTDLLDESQKEQILTSQFKDGVMPPTLHELRSKTEQAIGQFEAQVGTSRDSADISSQDYALRPWRFAFPLPIMLGGSMALLESGEIEPTQLRKMLPLLKRCTSALDRAESIAEALPDAIGIQAIEHVRNLDASPPPEIEPDLSKPWQPFGLAMLDVAIKKLTL